MKNTTIFKTELVRNYWKFLLASFMVGIILLFVDEGGKAMHSVPQWGEIANLVLFIFLISIVVTTLQALVFTIWKNSLLSIFIAGVVGIPICMFLYFFLMTNLIRIF